MAPIDDDRAARRFLAEASAAWRESHRPDPVVRRVPLRTPGTFAVIVDGVLRRVEIGGRVYPANAGYLLARARAADAWGRPQQAATLRALVAELTPPPNERR